MFCKTGAVEETNKPNSSLTLHYSHVIRLIFPTIAIPKEEINEMFWNHLLLSISPTDLPRNAFCIVVFPHGYKGFNAVASSVVPPNCRGNCVLFFLLWIFDESASPLRNSWQKQYRVNLISEILRPGPGNNACNLGKVPARNSPLLRSVRALQFKQPFHHVILNFNFLYRLAFPKEICLLFLFF